MNDKPRSRFWKIAIRVIFGLIGLVILCLFFGGVWLRYSGHRKWEQTKADLLSRGEKLSLMDFVPATIPDEQNFFADPIWQELNDFVEIEQNGHRIKKLRVEDGKRKLDQLDAPLNEEEVATLKKRFPIIEWPKVPLGQTTPRLVMIYMPNRMENKGSISDKKEVAEFVLTVLSSSQPILDHIKELAKRSDARFPIQYEDNIAANLRHLSYIMHISQILGIRANANLVLGNTQAVYEDVGLLFYLADTLKTEPFPISLLVRTSIIGIALPVIDRGLKAHAWTRDELDVFEKKLSGYHFIQNLAFALRCDRGAFNDMLNGVRRGNILQEVGNISDRTKFLANIGWQSYRILFIESDQAFYNQCLQQWIDSLDTATKCGLKNKEEEALFAKFEKMAVQSGGYSHLLSAVSCFDLIGVETKVALLQDSIIQARIACALERYWMKNGAYPQTLAPLTPDFIPAIPNDILTLQPMHYRLTAPDQYQLWSVGWDHVDDGGKLGSTLKEGDWIWGQWKWAKKK